MRMSCEQYEIYKRAIPKAQAALKTCIETGIGDENSLKGLIVVMVLSCQSYEQWLEADKENIGKK